MKARTPIQAMVAGAALSGVLIGPTPAWAAPSAPEPPAVVAEVRHPDWSYVRRLAGSDPRSTVKASAWAALTSRSVDAAINRFLAKDFDYAKKRAAEAKIRNADFARRVLDTHTAEFSPEVHAAAGYAMYGTAADQDYFARTGYAAAKQRDRQARVDSGAQAAALEQADRDFVGLLRDHDPGDQVRASAAYALRPAATDADLVKFFAHDWVDAAALDLEAFRIRCADADIRVRAEAARLFTVARAAELAARNTAGEAGLQLRETANRAWAAAGAETGPARVAWAQAQQVALAQAANWQQIAQAAGGAAGVNWAAVAGSSGVTAESWAAERENAAEQAAYWQGLYDEALAGEQQTSTADGAA
jgi:hypothetical protein